MRSSASQAQRIGAELGIDVRPARRRRFGGDVVERFGDGRNPFRRVEPADDDRAVTVERRDVLGRQRPRGIFVDSRDMAFSSA